MPELFIGGFVVVDSLVSEVSSLVISSELINDSADKLSELSSVSSLIDSRLLKGTFVWNPRTEREERRKYFSLVFLVTPSTEYSIPKTINAG